MSIKILRAGTEAHELFKKLVEFGIFFFLFLRRLACELLRVLNACLLFLLLLLLLLLLSFGGFLFCRGEFALGLRKS